jgi:hypothetical protein
VNDELNGYPQEKSVPAYRIIPARLVGNFANIAERYIDQTLPTSHLPEKIRKHCTENEMRESIHVLEAFAAKKDLHLRHPIQPELYSKIGEGLAPGWVLQSAWIQMEPTQSKTTSPPCKWRSIKTKERSS